MKYAPTCLWTRPLFFLSATVTPFILSLPVYAMWFRAWQVLGHAPRVSQDDPKNICKHDAVYQWMFNADDKLAFLPLAFVMILWVIVFLRIERRVGLEKLSTKDLICFLTALVLSGIHVFFGDVSAWWID